MQTGEDLQGLRKIIDFTRLLSISVLVIHFYFRCYVAFRDWGLNADIIDSVLNNVARSGLFIGSFKPKLIAIILLAVSLFGAKGKTDEKINLRLASTYIFIGSLLYFVSGLFLKIALQATTLAALYIGITATGYLLALKGGVMLSRLLKIKLQKDIFNRENETFPQEERLLENEFSVNLPAIYMLKGKIRKSWINIINPFRALLVTGTPGSGKSYFVIRHVIEQHIRKGF
ncbi:MAG TPA: YWFCY domain-containing protein, partial [Sphingobacteriaceae bacterium]